MKYFLLEVTGRPIDRASLVFVPLFCMSCYLPQLEIV
jgi:hypothetical protein